MGEVTYTVPVIGELVTAACPKVDTALTEIKTEVNGKIEATNIKNESITVDRVAKSGKWVNEGTFGSALKKSEHIEKEASATENTLVILTFIVAAGAVTAEVKAGGVKIGQINSPEGETIYPFGAFRLPAGEKWFVEVTAGSTGEVKTTSEFAYMKGVV